MMTHSKSGIFTLLLLALLYTPIASANEQPLYELEMVTADDGITVGLPVIDRQQLNQALADARVLLTAENHRLEQYIEDNRPSTNGTVIALIMPGGLMYLAYRQGIVASAKSNLIEVQGELVEIKTDVVALYEPLEGPVYKKIVVARYP